jgi:hypothetical protein
LNGNGFLCKGGAQAPSVRVVLKENAKDGLGNTMGKVIKMATNRQKALIWCETLSINEMKAALKRKYPNGPFTFTDFCNYLWVVEAVYNNEVN